MAASAEFVAHMREQFAPLGGASDAVFFGGRAFSWRVFRPSRVRPSRVFPGLVDREAGRDFDAARARGFGVGL